MQKEASYYLPQMEIGNNNDNFLASKLLRFLRPKKNNRILSFRKCFLKLFLEHLVGILLHFLQRLSGNIIQKISFICRICYCQKNASFLLLFLLMLFMRPDNQNCRGWDFY